ncbi:hypothetical protein LSH36_374g00033 [Paralvinella palmiformis]|uniref:Uncharacterized protein n=1 Tax=Paralvinella palmiformis TaxID=53620 RepID=A0AAD9JDM1_9ANNE|nr:hypothetical protein LSH36_374g00033 [Paralvinella palmiformis]
MARLYTLCCVCKTQRRRRAFCSLLMFVAITTAVTMLSSSPPENKKSIDVFVIEEHHEALSYWHRFAITNKINRTGNTLIHIDAHPDMAAPEFLPGMPDFTWSTRQQQVIMLMQKNDVFIQGAVMIGMLSHIIWIYPSWDKNYDLNEHEIFIFEIGILTTKRNDNNHKIICECRTPVDKYTYQVRAGTKSECSYSREDDNGSDDEITIEKEFCRTKRSLLVEAIVGEVALEALKKSSGLNEPTDVILDIDEDFFGCERGGTTLENVRIPWSVVERLDRLTNELLCPKNAIHEEAGDRLMKGFIADFVRLCRLATESTCNVSSRVIVDRVKGSFLKQHRLTPRMFCQDRDYSLHLLRNTADVFRTLKYNQLVRLADLGFCLSESPATYGFENGNAEFSVCHGAISANDHLVFIYVPEEEELTKQMSLVRSILARVTAMQPNIVTLCRSVRDGYTPRHLAKRIEGDIVDFFNRSHEGIKYNLIYDDNLFGGKEGWHGRYKAYLK